MGRPSKRVAKNKKIGAGVSKMKPDVIRKLEEVFAIDGTIEEACYYADISPATYYVWVKNNKKLLERFTALRNRPVLKARQTVVKSLDDADCAFKYLSKKKKNEFGDTLDLTSKGEKINDMSYERAETILRGEKGSDKGSL